MAHPRIVITVAGGLVTGVYGDTADVEVYVVDFDNNGPERINGEACSIALETPLVQTRKELPIVIEVEWAYKGE
jgi:hypothetical protein